MKIAGLFIIYLLFIYAWLLSTCKKEFDEFRLITLKGNSRGGNSRWNTEVVDACCMLIAAAVCMVEHSGEGANRY